MFTRRAVPTAWLYWAAKLMRLFRLITNRYRRLAPTTLRVMFTVLALVSLAATGWVAVESMRYVDAHSDECLWAEVKVAPGVYFVFVTEIVPGGRADLAGVRPGDRVLAIAGRWIGSDSGASHVAQKILDESPTNVPLQYLVERQGRPLELTIELLRVVRYFQFAAPTLSLLWVLIGLLVVYSRPTGAVQQLFLLLGLTSLFGLTFDPPRLGVEGLVRGLVWGVLGMSFYVIWVRFTAIFPVDQKIFERARARWYLYLPVLALSVVTVVNLALISAGVKFTMTYLDVLRVSVYAIVTGYFVAGIWLLFRGYGRLPATSDRRPIKAILIGSILAAVVFVYLAIVQSGRNQSVVVLYPQYLLPLLLMLALPISFGYAIFRYQVMDFRPVMRATVTYGAMLVLIGGAYLGVAYGAGQAFGSLAAGEVSLPLQLLLFVAFVLLFDPLKRALQRSMENRFFPQRRDFTPRLAAYTEAIAETMGTRAVAALMARTLREALDLRGVWILLESERENALELVARDTELPAVTLDGDSLDRLLNALRHSHAVLRLDTTSDVVSEELMDYFAYGMGLHAQGRLIGIVLLGETLSGEPLSGRQYPFLNGVLTQGGSAIEVARLYEAELSRQRYLEELNTARRIQESLLPATMPSIPGIAISAMAHPAQMVGGDYYDVIPVDEHRFVVIIADVSGKGLPASLYMAELHGMFRIACVAAQSPRKMLTVINRHLYDVITRSSFITATVMVFDTSRSVVSIARAGHTPVLRRRSGAIDVVDSLVPTGLPLGARVDLFDRFLEEITIEYDPGDLFVLYSDGVSEAMNSAREEYGEQRLIGTVTGRSGRTAAEICDDVLNGIVEFRGGTEPNDDITVVVVQVDGDAAMTAQASDTPEIAAIPMAS